MSVSAIETGKAFEETISTHPNGVVVHFAASWCEPCKPLNAALAQLAPEYPAVLFAQLDAEALADVAQSLKVENVPFVLFFKDGTKDPVASVSGANVKAIRSKLVELYGTPAPATSAPAAAAAATASAESLSTLNDRLRAIINQAPVVLLLKGTPQEPICGFSRQMVQLLAEEGLAPGSYGHFNILTDEAVRQGIKAYSNFPTFPQLYVSGELIGGLDICKELKASGELKETLAA